MTDEERKERRRESDRRYKARNLEKIRESSRLASRKRRETEEGREKLRQASRLANQKLRETEEGREKLRQASRRDNLKRRETEEGREKLRQANRRANQKRRETEEGREKRRRVEQKLRENPYYRLVCRLRSRLRSALQYQGALKSQSTLELLGIDRDGLRSWLEAQFKPGMTWDNMGEWHVDHLRPCASFDLNDPEQQKQCFHYRNLQPLWAYDNLSKGAKLLSERQLL